MAIMFHFDAAYSREVHVQKSLNDPSQFTETLTIMRKSYAITAAIITRTERIMDSIRHHHRWQISHSDSPRLCPILANDRWQWKLEPEVSGEAPVGPDNLDQERVILHFPSLGYLPSFLRRRAVTGECGAITNGLHPSC